MVTVEVDLACVESRLLAGEIGCPTCQDGVLGGWGYARVRQVEGLSDPVRPRRARCRTCAVTHVLLPVTMLLRRAYAAKRIWAALTARADGFGHRRIGVRLSVPTTTVRAWLRRVGSRLEMTRVWFLQVAVTAGVDVTIPEATGSAWADMVAAAATATTAIKSRFGAAGLLGMVTPVQVAVATSGGQLLSPGWSPQCR